MLHGCRSDVVSKAKTCDVQSGRDAVEQTLGSRHHLNHTGKLWVILGNIVGSRCVEADSLDHATICCDGSLIRVLLVLSFLVIFLVLLIRLVGGCMLLFVCFGCKLLFPISWTPDFRCVLFFCV
jgi:hypothetical protein